MACGRTGSGENLAAKSDAERNNRFIVSIFQRTFANRHLTLATRDVNWESCEEASGQGQCSLSRLIDTRARRSP